MSRLATRGLSFAYRAGEPLIQEWSESFDSGEFVAITGPSGRGKSTLLYLLGLMLRPAAGAVLVDGHEVSGMPDARRSALRATRFGFVFQDHALDAHRTVLDNVLEGALYRGDDRRAVASRAHALLERFGVTHRADARPGEISGGQAQRIALCRALLGDPGILLADEPTGNLDRTTAAAIVDAMRDHSRDGATVVVVTHDERVVGRCDRRIEL